MSFSALKLFEMLSFSGWMLSALLLGPLISGVNREVPDNEISNASTGLLSGEAAKILHFCYKDSHAHEIHIDSEEEEEIVTGHSRHVRSVRSSYETMCSHYDSCAGRCGEAPRPLPFTCNCDPLCTEFSDCCLDYNHLCGRENDASVEEKQLENLPRLRCDVLFMRYIVLTVSTCPQDNNADERMCSVEIPKDCLFYDDTNATDSERIFAECHKTVYGNCMSKLRRSCDPNYEPLCNVLAVECRKKAESECRRCQSDFWPVLGADGVVYKNSYCASCNNQKSDVILSPSILKAKIREIKELNSTDRHSLYFSRECVPVDVDHCPGKEVDDEAVKLCRNHTGAVIAMNKQKLIYRNAHCAVCNGEVFEDLRCVTKSSLIGRLFRPLLKTFITGDVQGIKFDVVPAAFSILLNFGLDGRERMFFSSEDEEDMRNYQKQCKEGEIWDPFSEVCRKLYCSTEFVLVDYRCVRRNESAGGESAHENRTRVVPDVEFYHLTLSVEMEMLDFLVFNGQDIETIRENARVSLANSFNINAERIKNVKINISLGDGVGMKEKDQFIDEMDDFHPITFTLEFDLYEASSANATEPEPSMDNIVSMLASSVSINGFELDFNNITSRISEIHQTVSPLTSWCRPEDGGGKREYWNSEFTLVLNDENSTSRANQIKGIYVNSTGRFYSQGKYVASILFQGYQFSSNLINVSGVAVVCERKLNESCMRIMIDPGEYSILENDSLIIHADKLRNIVDDSAYERAENDTIWVCMKSLKTNGKQKVFGDKDDFIQALVSYVLLWVSVVALAAVLVTYVLFESLRNLPGCNTMNLAFSLIAMQLTFLFGEGNTVSGTSCTVVGHILHYEILCCFMWMNVMAFDLYRTFGSKNLLNNIRSKRKYLPRYMVYAYASPLSVIFTASLLDYLANESSLAPNYGKNDVCWIVNQHAAIVFFAVPLAAIMLVNLFLFLLTIHAMRGVKNLFQAKDLPTHRSGKNDLFLYARMALVVGLTWILSFAAAFSRQSELPGKILTYLFIIFNTLQGVFVFSVFVCNKRVYGLYRGAIRDLFRAVSKRAKYESSSVSISKFSDAMKRTVSSNTVVSTVSNASTLSNASQLSTLSE